VEEDAEELFHKAIAGAHAAIQKNGIDISLIKGIGITNQRETTLVWDRHTGKPVTNALSGNVALLPQ